MVKISLQLGLERCFFHEVAGFGQVMSRGLPSRSSCQSGQGQRGFFSWRSRQHGVQATRLNWRDFDIGRLHSHEFVSDVSRAAAVERLTLTLN